jgi:hypothetical protein
VHRPQPGRRKLGRVAHQQQHALAGRDAERAQRIGGTRDIGCQLGVADRLLAADQRRAPSVPLERRATEKVFYSVQAVSCRDRFSCRGSEFRLGS